MSRSSTPKLAVAALVFTLAAAPAALAAATHQTPTSHRVKHNALTTGAWTPMVDESRAQPPFDTIVDYQDALARFMNRP